MKATLIIRREKPNNFTVEEMQLTMRTIIGKPLTDENYHQIGTIKDAEYKDGVLEVIAETDSNFEWHGSPDGKLHLTIMKLSDDQK